MRRALRSLREVAPSSLRPSVRGVRACLARAAGGPGRRALVAASVLAGVVLSPVGTMPSTAQAGSDHGALDDVAMVTEPDGPDAIDVGDDAGAPAPDTTTPASAGSDGLIHLRLVPGESELRYVIGVRTLGQSMRQSACATRAVTGELVLTPNGDMVGTQSKIVADMRTLHCESPLRDSNAQLLLETQKYPMAEATFDQAPGLVMPLPVGDARCQLIGQQTVHGVTRPADYTTVGIFGANDVTGHATTEEKLTNFGIRPPQIGPLLQVQDDITIQLDFHATIGG